MMIARPRYPLRAAAYLLLLLPMLLFPRLSPAAEEGFPGALLFVPHEFWLTPEQARTVVESAAEAGFDGLAVTVWHGRGATWPSAVAPMSDAARQAGGDPLARLLESAARRDMNVLPVVSVTHRTGDIFPEWDGGKGVNRAFNAHDREFRSFMLGLVGELLDSYPVDGLILDYIRTKGICRLDTCEANYAELLGADLHQDARRYKRSAEARERLTRWNAAAVRDLVSGISRLTKEQRIPLAVATHPGHEGAALQGADGIAWANAGLVDYLLAMNYESVEDLPTDRLDRSLARLNDPAKLVLILGNFEKGDGILRNNIRGRKPAEIAPLVTYARSFNPANESRFAVFTYRYLDEPQRALFRQLAAR